MSWSFHFTGVIWYVYVRLIVFPSHLFQSAFQVSEKSSLHPCHTFHTLMVVFLPCHPGLVYFLGLSLAACAGLQLCWWRSRGILLDQAVSSPKVKSHLHALRESDLPLASCLV